MARRIRICHFIRRNAPEFAVIGVALAFFVSGMYVEQYKQLAETQAELFDHINKDMIANDAKVIADSEGQIVDWQPGMQEVLGWSTEEVLGMPIENLIIGEYREKHALGYAAAMDKLQNASPKEQRQELNLVHYIPCKAKHKDGSSVPVTIRVQLRKGKDGTRYAVANFDKNAKMLRSMEEAWD